MKSQAALEMDRDRDQVGERRAPSPFVRLAFAPSLPDLVVRATRERVGPVLLSACATAVAVVPLAKRQLMA